ncbi:YcxB family protein [Pararhizobium sp.]|uniref:YcxB family protein n=1 Tax=Pararhizobium sp. TaxID=1977563 RepID=UPI003D1382C1
MSDIKISQTPSVFMTDGVWRFSHVYSSSELAASRKEVRNFSASQGSTAKKTAFLTLVLILLVLYLLTLAVCSALLIDYLYDNFPWMIMEYANNAFGVALYIFIALTLHFSILFLFRILSLRPKSGAISIYDYEITTSSVTTDGNGQRTETRWNAVTMFGETKNYFVVSHRFGVYIAIPKRAFSNVEMLADFKKFCEQALNAAKSTNGKITQ